MSKAKKDDTKKTDDKKNKTPSTTENKGQDDQKGPGNTDTQAQAVLVNKAAKPKETLEQKVEALQVIDIQRWWCIFIVTFAKSSHSPTGGGQ